MAAMVVRQIKIDGNAGAVGPRRCCEYIYIWAVWGPKGSGPRIRHANSTRHRKGAADQRERGGEAGEDKLIATWAVCGRAASVAPGLSVDCRLRR
jgi:hypothetical protein